MTILYNMCTKSRPNDFLTITLEVDYKFPSNLARGVSDNFLTTWYKTFHFTSQKCAHYLVKILKATKRNRNGTEVNRQDRIDVGIDLRT